MIFIVDEQLPRSLARLLVQHGQQAHHTFDLGLNAKSDDDVWAAARDMGAVIITKDGDFVLRERSSGDPQVVWWRRGNETRQQVLDCCAAELPAIVIMLSAGRAVVEVL